MRNCKFKIVNLKLKNFKICNLQFAIYNSRRAGFTLIELMIAITITVLAMAAVYTSFIVQQRSFTTQDQVAETEVSSKIAFDMLVNDIRTAGFGYPADENPLVNTFTEAININNAAGANNSDTINLIGGFRQIATLQNFVPNTPNQIMINYTGSTEFNLTNRRNLSIDGIFFAAITPIAGCTIVNNTCSDAQPLILDRDILVDIPAGRPVYLVEDVTYRIAMDANGVNNLEKVSWINNTSTTDVVANNIDDFQIACAIDTDADNLIDDQNGNGTIDPNDYISPPLPAGAKILAVRINLLARTANEDQTLDPNTKPYFATGITLEGNVTPENDRFRRRIWSMEVALRN